MERSYFSVYLSGVCLAIALSVAVPASAGSRVEGPVALSGQAAEKGALSVAREPNGGDEPLYAGTSMWLLLSIALLGSIAVQRRNDDTE